MNKNFTSTLRVIGLTATVILIVFFGFQIFKDRKIDAQGIITLLVLLVDLVYLVMGTTKDKTQPLQ